MIAGFPVLFRFRDTGGKSGQHRARVLANGQAARADGKCNRKHTADGFSGNTGKGEMAGQEPTAVLVTRLQCKPHPLQVQIEPLSGGPPSGRVGR